MKASRTNSFFQLQLGQEVIYLLLSFFALLVLVLATLVSSQQLQIAAHLQKIEELEDILKKMGGDAEKLLAMARRAKEVETMLADQLSLLTGLRGQLADTQAQLRLSQSNAAANKAEADRAKARIKELEDELTALKTQLRQLTDQPPIISLPEAQGYTFEVGENSLSSEFRRRLKDKIIDELVQMGERYNANVIEVIGHTDEQPVSGRVSNLDSSLLSFLKGGGGVVAGDNTGLGMARAASVARELMADPRLTNYAILPLSGGQVIEVGDKLSAGSGELDVRERRRIEIRLRRR